MTERSSITTKISELFLEVGKNYRERGLVEFELHQGNGSPDVHAFYRLSHNPSKVIHVKGYPGMSSESRARVWARLMDYSKMMRIRESGRTSIGNEHGAVVKSFGNFLAGIYIPYHPVVLEDRLAENIPELNRQLKVVR